MKRIFGIGLVLLSLFYLASCSPGQNQGCPDIDDAIARAIKSESGFFAPGELGTEGHIILETEEDEGIIKLYTLASYGEFGFENGIFTVISGSGAIPTIITFQRDENGEYVLLDYQEPIDGTEYVDSLKRMFPPHLHSRVLSADVDYPALAGQQEKQAEEYLKSIGREARVSAEYVEKTLADIDVEASNKLFAEMAKDDAFLNSCPYWLGTLERIENETRYVYETSQSKTGDGYDLMIYQKKKEDGTVVEERKYKIVGSEPRLVGGENEPVDESTSGAPREVDAIVYENTRYGFTFSLPAGWRGYTIVVDKWEGNDAGSANISSETGALVSIRHPQWTPESPRQDIPIMVLTLAQWEALQRGKFQIGAAPIGPKELGRNSKYVFALPARYNYAFPTGYEEVETILGRDPLRAGEEIDTGPV